MLRKIRIALGLLFLAGITLLFLDFTGAAHAWLGWMAKVQFLPAVLALNVGVVVGLVALTLIFGRVYCSVICPLGVFQDIFGHLGRLGKKQRYRYGWSKGLTWLRASFLVVFIALLLAGFASIAALVAPYSLYGRFTASFLTPAWIWLNNLLARVAEHYESYAFYSVDLWMRSLWALVLSGVTMAVIVVLAWRNGRTWCNTVCPVGTVLGFLSRFSLLKPVIDTDKCNNCGLCARQCKAACINSKEHSIDYSRCVACMDCIDNCRHGAISYRRPVRKAAKASGAEGTDGGRRAFMVGAGVAATVLAVKAQKAKVDGGMAAVTEKKAPERSTPIVPPGAVSLDHLSQHCTACQLCVSACPNGVLHPSTDPSRLMQPECSYERGYCRPECTRCGDVCPTGAIRPVSKEEKTGIQIGHAVWVRANCIVLADGVECGACARHCPAGAITMIPSDVRDEASPKVPMVNPEKCIGCGKCEQLCPASPFSAIYVEGHERHREI